MGSSSSKFRKHLQNGDEYAALQLYNSNADLRKGLDPNMSYGDTYNHDTALHFAARHSMKSLLRIFLYDHGGNPNKKNSRNETSLHCVCQCLPTRNLVLQQRRADCLTMVLQWRGATLKDGEIEKVDLAAQDEKDNTALHYAAASGLKRCAELLVSQNAPLFTENATKQTPCDCCELSNSSEIAHYLESKMVFCNEEDNTEDLDSLLDQMETEQGYSGLRAQDLQEAKDQLLVETSDMLRVPLFTAEALLRNHEWSREMLLEAWMGDPIACCDKCGVVPPSTVIDETAAPSTSCSTFSQHASTSAMGTVSPITMATTSAVTIIADDDTSDSGDVICDICTCEIDSSVPMSCEHQFCTACWERYLTGKIQEGEAHNITCPGFECSKLVPVELIETLVSRDMARRYLQFDIKAFVESNPSIKWCPYPGCGRAVRLPEAADNPLSPRGMNDMSESSDFSHAVDCGSGHLFCWECLGEAHEPVSCSNWKKWHQRMSEINPASLGDTEDETEMAANCLWLVTNSKSCPNCKSPIQKNEGCNHMKCSKCKHDFCWVCLEPWKKHSSATGGYFRCNRYEVLKKVDENTQLAKAEAEARNKRMQELNRFVHYYARFKNHEHSFELEKSLSTTAKEKMVVLAKAITDPDTANLETKFVEDAVHQLLKARRVLKCCYAYGYYLEDTGYKKPIFEFMQTELEECTETLSEMIARPYLRTPRSKIIQTAHLVQRKRHEFVTAISKGLVPPDTSPNQRKRKKYSVELDDDLKKALMASIQDIDPSNPWVKDPTGKHTNVSLLLDWPEEDDEDSESEQSQSQTQPQTPCQQLQEETEETTSDAACTVIVAEEEEDEDENEECTRANCTKSRARNPRTGRMHQYCSARCMRADHGDQPTAAAAATVKDITDYQMDLLRALEMSRLQFLKEMGQLRPGSGDRSPHSPRSPAPEHVSRPATAASCSSSTTELVLAEPPKGRLRVRSEPGRDPELQRALELSRMSLNEEERDLRLAIELSLADATKLPSRAEDPHSAEYSTIVTRVPNKSVEDLARMPNPFGLIKDLQVSNILPEDSDKTKDFNDKDFSQVFVKYASPTDQAAMLEHRPPQSPYSPRDPPPELRIAPPPEARPPVTPPAAESEVDLDPADLHVDTQLLESLLQGAEHYTNSGSPRAEHVILLPADDDEDDDDDDADAVFV